MITNMEVLVMLDPKPAVKLPGSFYEYYPACDHHMTFQASIFRGLTEIKSYSTEWINIDNFHEALDAVHHVHEHVWFEH